MFFCFEWVCIVPAPRVDVLKRGPIFFKNFRQNFSSRKMFDVLCQTGKCKHNKHIYDFPL